MGLIVGSYHMSADRCWPLAGGDVNAFVQSLLTSKDIGSYISHHSGTIRTWELGILVK